MRKGIITLGIIAVIALAMTTLGPLAFQFFSDRGLQTASISSGGEPASTDMNGTWEIAKGAGTNRTQAGYTFDEVLPGQRKSTSGRADNEKNTNITGGLTVENNVVKEGSVDVLVDGITSDVEKRDINVRNHILNTKEYPHAKFTLTKPVDISSLPSDGKPGEISVTGDLTLRGKTNSVTTTLKVLRTGKHVIIEGKVPFARKDYGINSPQFVASKIAENGTVDLLLVMEKKQ
ncbi:YceI family protein [Corynebacterium heidelbergense]|uniref:Lipid/polyisoprenoid-binding YceI-like domain-containing protein n=1 Tax=Corynebacterium heidelbergense TaxID=2055947 RepID=A0A364V4Z5_9CORY|nr:YceI family protein [Corynebacterium heidelbergense]RAV31691.1 hypothetical protein DLJ54_07035 [Corynebacterium heidelbergense]